MVEFHGSALPGRGKRFFVFYGQYSLEIASLALFLLIRRGKSTFQPFLEAGSFVGNRGRLLRMGRLLLFWQVPGCIKTPCFAPEWFAESPSLHPVS